MHLFVYGTLMCEEIMRRVTGTTWRSCEAILEGYKRRTIKGEVYPGIVSDPHCSTRGRLYFDVPETAIQQLDRFEGQMYKRCSVEVHVANTGERVSAQTYVLSESYRNRLGPDPWSFEAFLKNGKKRFLAEYPGFACHYGFNNHGGHKG
ncbi:MAG: gamma-glutamylcyclotransferase family protein [Kiritimatiellia bacterium]